VIQLPDGDSLERTDAVVRAVTDIILKHDGVGHADTVGELSPSHVNLLYSVE
jgi:multidrug efflux pump subunit AcrB